VSDRELYPPRWESRDGRPETMAGPESTRAWFGRTIRPVTDSPSVADPSAPPS